MLHEDLHAIHTDSGSKNVTMAAAAATSRNDKLACI
jgi:hypothetical protein